MDQLNPAESARLEMLIQKKQQKEFVKMFFKVTADCFDACIADFNSKVLSAREEACITRCTDKFMKSSERIGLRFSDENQKLMQQGPPGGFGQ